MKIELSKTIKLISLVAVIMLAMGWLLKQKEHVSVTTQNATVIHMKSNTASRVMNRRGTPALLKVELEDGSRVTVQISPQKRLSKGDIVAVDIYETDGKKPRYYLARDPIAP